MSGAVIKAGDADARTRGMYRLDLRDVAADARGLLDAARKEAGAIVAEATREAARMPESTRRAALDEGRTQGLEEGRRAGEQQALDEARARLEREQGALVAALTKTFEEFAARRDAFFAAARRDVIVLAIAIASRITSRLRSMEHEMTAAAIESCEDALNVVADATEVVIRVHPDDAAALDQLTDHLASLLRSSGHLRLAVDASLARGDVVVETAETTIDATINGRIQTIADELVTEWRRRMTELAITS
jgi:flagellar biosynthesis/type III secretory pathway protein FliH